MRRELSAMACVWGMVLALMGLATGGAWAQQVNVVLYESNATYNVGATTAVLIATNMQNSRRTLFINAVTNGVRFLRMNGTKLTNWSEYIDSGNATARTNTVIGWQSQTNLLVTVPAYGVSISVNGAYTGWYEAGEGIFQGAIYAVSYSSSNSTVQVVQGLFSRP